MRSRAFLLMLPLMEQPTTIGPNSAAAMMPPITANPIAVANRRFARRLFHIRHRLRGAVVSTMAAPALWVIRVDFGMPVGIRLAAYWDVNVHVNLYNQLLILPVAARSNAALVNS